MSINNNPWSSATLNAMFKIPSCVSFKPNNCANKIGPISEIVVRMLIPFSPKTSQKATGYELGSKSST